MAAWSGPTSCATRRASFASTLDEKGATSRGDAPSFCARPDPEPYLAAIGIFSLDDHRRHRVAIRASWLRSAARASMIARFVLHGLAARSDVLAEATAHGDTVFLRAEAVMSCKAGPLRKLLLWLECALSAWPRAELIGKADDDTWVHLPGVAAHVSRSLSALQAKGLPRAALVWGSIESYHWHEGVHRPVGFTGMRYAYRRLPGTGRLERCRQRRAPRLTSLPNRDVPRAWLQSDTGEDDANVTGPYFYPKGPFYLVAARLVKQMLSSAWVRREGEAAIQSGEREADVVELTWPWEDVFLGAALTHSARPSLADDGTNTQPQQQLAVVHVGATGRPGSVFSEEWGVKAAPSTLVWHMRTKVPERVHLLERWAAVRRCDRVFEAMEYCAEYVACSGAVWQACEHALPKRKERASFALPATLGSNCSDRLEDVNKLLASPSVPPASTTQPQASRF